MYEVAARLTLKNNGGTFTPAGHAVLLRHGYMVGGVVPTHVEVLHDVAQVADTLEWFAHKHADILESHVTFLGTWIDGGRVYLDVSQHVVKREDALALGRARGELAIWDCAEGEEISCAS